MGRRVEDLAKRFERQVDRSGEHHLWLGAINPARGTGRLKVDEVTMTAHRVAWELTHGPLGPKQPAGDTDRYARFVEHQASTDGHEVALAGLGGDLAGVEERKISAVDHEVPTIDTPEALHQAAKASANSTNSFSRPGTEVLDSSLKTAM